MQPDNKYLYAVSFCHNPNPGLLTLFNTRFDPDDGSSLKTSVIIQYRCFKVIQLDFKSSG